MKYIKEHDAYSNRCTIRIRTYASSLKHFLEMAEIAKKDYPTLEDKDIEIVQYGGKSYKRTFGIEFNVQEPTEDYTKVPYLEAKL